MFASMILVPYVFTVADFFAWKQEVKKTDTPRIPSNGESRCFNMGTALDTKNSEEGGKWQINCRRRYVGASYKLDILKMPRVMYEEAKAAVVYGIVAITMEHYISPYLKFYAGSPWLVAVPLSFFLMLCLIRPFEANILHLFIPSSVEVGHFEGRSLRLQRIIQNVALLGTLLLVHATPVNWFNLISDSQIEHDLKENLEWVPYHYLLFMLRLSRKLRGAFALVIVYRIYIDLAIQTFSHFIGQPADKDFTPPEPEEERALVQKGESRMDYANGNMDNGNQSESETETFSVY